MLSKFSRIKHAISRTATIAIVIIVIIIIAAGGFYALTVLPKSSTSSTTTPTTSTTSTTSTVTPSSCTNTPYSSTPSTTFLSAQSINKSVAPPGFTPNSTNSAPSSLTYYYTNSFQYLDPSISYYEEDYEVISSVYEPLFFYNGANNTVIPWLAENYSVSKDGMTVNINLWPNITFQDGETLNSTAVYFTLNRLLLLDNSAPGDHGSQASWILQQLVDPCLSSVLGGNFSSANVSPSTASKYVNDTLAQDFVQITGPYSLTLHIQHPNAALPYLLAGDWASILAPDWVMSNDIALWSGRSSEGGYTLPYTTLSGNVTQQMDQYFVDLASTCNTGATPSGCGYTSLIGNTADLAAGSNYHPLAGTGPYEITYYDSSTGTMTLTANPSYWGGPYARTDGNNTYSYAAHINTITYSYQTDQQTRETDLKSAADAGQAATADIATTNLFDLANKTAWNDGLGTLVPNAQWAGLIFFTPPTGYSTLSNYFYGFTMNITNPLTGALNTFQPFADLRIREAFALSLNMTEINADYNSGLGTVLNSVYAPGLPPTDSYNSTMPSNSVYNPDLAAQLLLQAMENPVTSFNFANGTKAPSGYFNNAFGCTTLPASGTCSNPTKQTITITVGAGDTTDLAAFEQIETTIDNISSTYNMGLSVSVQVLPIGQLYSEQASSSLQLNWEGWIADYPWVVDFMKPTMGAEGTFTAGANINNAYLNNLLAQANTATATDNVTGLVKVANLAAQYTNNQYYYIDAYALKSTNQYTTAISPSSVLINPVLGYALWQSIY